MLSLYLLMDIKNFLMLCNVCKFYRLESVVLSYRSSAVWTLAVKAVCTVYQMCIFAVLIVYCTCVAFREALLICTLWDLSMIHYMSIWLLAISVLALHYSSVSASFSAVVDLDISLSLLVKDSNGFLVLLNIYLYFAMQAVSTGNNKNTQKQHTKRQITDGKW